MHLPPVRFSVALALPIYISLGRARRQMVSVENTWLSWCCKSFLFFGWALAGDGFYTSDSSCLLIQQALYSRNSFTSTFRFFCVRFFGSDGELMVYCCVVATLVGV